MSDNYWSRVLDGRISRRRALAATGAMAASAAFLAACGGSDSGSSSGGGAQKDVSSLIVKAVDDTKSVKRGGTYKTRGTFEPSTLDPHQFPNNFYVYQTYSNLWMIKDGVIDYSNGDVEGDVVESWELSPDKLTLTAKINSNAHFAPVAPVNGRSVDAKDVVFTWERHRKSSNQRSDFDNATNPAAPTRSPRPYLRGPSHERSSRQSPAPTTSCLKRAVIGWTRAAAAETPPTMTLPAPAAAPRPVV